MAVVFSDEFTGGSGSIEGRAVSGHTWHVYQGTAALDGSGEVVLRSEGIAYVAMPEIDSVLDFEVEFKIAGAYDIYFTAGIRQGPATPTYAILFNDPSALSVLPGAASMPVIDGLAPLVPGDVVTMRFEASIGMFKLLVNGSQIASSWLSGTPSNPHIVLTSWNSGSAGMDPGFSSVVVRTLEAPTPSDFWANLSGAREVI